MSGAKKMPVWRSDVGRRRCSQRSRYAACSGGGGGDVATPPTPPVVVNTPPVANAGPDQLVTTSAAVTLNGAGSSDPGGSIATYAWTQTGGAAVTLTGAATATPGFTAPASSGSLTFQLTVTDNGGATHSDTMAVTVNAPPVANAGADQTVSAGAAVSLNGSGSDADGSITSYAWTQTGGPAVALSGAASATISFTAPAAAASLAFQLTVTDNRGAARADSVSVTVAALPPPPAAPTIGRHPTSPSAFVHGSALLFVAAAGDDLTYEWRRSSGAVVKTGPEPFVLRSGLSMLDNGDCYYVVISNSAGVATSEQGCLTVMEVEGELDPSDDPNDGDDVMYADAYANTLMSIAQLVAGQLTGYVGGGMRLGVPREADAPHECHRGSYEGMTVDGVMLTVATGTLPLGRHTLTEAWDDCYTDPDDFTPQHGGYMVEYDFPETFGVGTLTIHTTGDSVNGTVQATIVAHNDAGHRSDDIEITIADNFSAGYLKTSSAQTISIDRRYTSDGLRVDDVYLDFDASMVGYDEEGSVGALFARQGGFFHLHQDFGGGDDGVSDYSSSGVLVVGLSTYILATFEPSGEHEWLGAWPDVPGRMPRGICVRRPAGSALRRAILRRDLSPQTRPQ